jgi:hypothetical protein
MLTRFATNPSEPVRALTSADRDQDPWLNRMGLEHAAPKQFP